MIPINLVYDPSTGRLAYDPVTGRIVCAGKGSIPYFEGSWPTFTRNGWTYRKTGNSLAAMQSAAWAANTTGEIGGQNVLNFAGSASAGPIFRASAVAYKADEYLAPGTLVGKITVNIFDRSVIPGPDDPPAPRGDVQLGWAATDSNTPPSNDWTWVSDAPYVSLDTTGNHVIQANLVTDAYIWLFSYYEYTAYNNYTRFEVYTLPVEI